MPIRLPASVIVKLPSDDPGSHALGVGIGAYEAEVRFYAEPGMPVGVRVRVSKP